VNLFGGDDVNGVLETGLNVFNLEIGVVVANDFVKRKPFAGQFQHTLNRNSGPRNTGLSKVDLRVDRDSVLHGFTSLDEREFTRPTRRASSGLVKRQQLSIVESHDTLYEPTNGTIGFGNIQRTQLDPEGRILYRPEP
jgi:hypothetical protein